MGAEHRLLIQRDWRGAQLSEAAGAWSLQPRPEGLWLEARAPWRGDPPPLEPPGSLDGLWSYEVMELFLLGPDQRYLELELGPHGHYLCLVLQGRRRRVGEPHPLSYRARRQGSEWLGECLLPWSLIPEGPLRANAYAIHGQGEQRRYLAWRPVPGPEPDFHRLENFAELDLRRPQSRVPRS